MCDVCKVESIDSSFINGPNKNKMVRVKLYKVYRDNVATVTLCHIHSIELFLIGEIKFFQNHKRFALNFLQKVREGEEDEFYLDDYDEAA